MRLPASLVLATLWAFSVGTFVSPDAEAQIAQNTADDASSSARAAARALAREALSTTGGHPSGLIYPEQQLPLRFSHRRHLELGAQCTLCHASTSTSEDARDRNLPGHAQCGICHLMEQEGAAELYPPAGCETCHLYETEAGEGTADAEMERKPAQLVFPPAKISFSHKRHLDLGVPCLECHKGVPEAALATREHLPAMSTCLKCHNGAKAPSECTTCHLQGEGGLLLTDVEGGSMLQPRGRFRPDNHLHPDWQRAHSGAARLAPESCDSCHSPSVCLDCHDGKKPREELHPGDWIMNHGLEAGRRGLQCQACHDKTAFCVDCHEQAAVTPANFPGLSGDPQGASRFHPVGWRGELGEIAGPEHHSHVARRSLETCDACHEQSSCLECHSFINPHPRSWADPAQDWRFGQGEGRMCTNCHRPDDPALQLLRR
jgi:hypothetical protein